MKRRGTATSILPTMTEAASAASAADSSSSTTSSSKEEVVLSDVAETLLCLLWWRAQDAGAPNPILGDPHAQAVLESVEIEEYSKSSLFANDQRWVRYVCNRAKTLDKWCQQFINTHENEPIQVVHIGCGLDARNLRVDWHAKRDDVRWIDIDLPVVCDLRSRVMPRLPEGADYSLRSLSVMKDGWYRDIPADRKTFVVCEALIYYFEPHRVEQLWRDVVGYFGAGQLAFDLSGTLVVRHHPSPLRRTSLRVRFGVDDAREYFERCCPGLRMTGRLRWDEYFGDEAPLGQSAPPIFGPWTTALLSLRHSATFRDALQVVRFDFGTGARSVTSSELDAASASASSSSVARGGSAHGSV